MVHTQRCRPRPQMSGKAPTTGDNELRRGMPLQDAGQRFYQVFKAFLVDEPSNCQNDGVSRSDRKALAHRTPLSILSLEVLYRHTVRYDQRARRRSAEPDTAFAQIRAAGSDPRGPRECPARHRSEKPRSLGEIHVRTVCGYDKGNAPTGCYQSGHRSAWQNPVRVDQATSELADHPLKTHRAGDEVGQDQNICEWLQMAISLQ